MNLRTTQPSDWAAPVRPRYIVPAAPADGDALPSTHTNRQHQHGPTASTRLHPEASLTVTDNNRTAMAAGVTMLALVTAATTVALVAVMGDSKHTSAVVGAILIGGLAWLGVLAIPALVRSRLRQHAEPGAADEVVVLGDIGQQGLGELR